MIGCLRTRVPTQPIIALYFESETVLKFYNLEARRSPEGVCSGVTETFQFLICEIITFEPRHVISNNVGL